jgi:hypothetical protein
LALANPGARVVALDACIAPLTEQGLALTNRIAAEEGLNVVAIKGWSPDDVPRAAAECMQAPDLVLIDAWHDDAHQTADFEAARRLASPDCVYLFHDVIGCRMLRSFLSYLRSDDGMTGTVLTRTQSGMGILYPRARSGELGDLVKTFTDRNVVVGGAQADIELQLPSQETGQVVGLEAFN